MTCLIRTFVFASLGLGCLLLLQTSSAEEELTLDQLIDRNVQAARRRAVEVVHAIKFDLQIVDQSFEIDGTYYAARPGQMRIDIVSRGKRIYAEAFDGNHAWQWKGKGEPVEESAVATRALRHGVELPGKLFGLDEVQRRGNELALVGREPIANLNYYVLRLTFPDGVRTTLYVDPNTWLITRRREVRPLHPDVDPTATTIETTMSDFRKVGDLLLSFASSETDLKTGRVLEKTVVRQITLNPPIPSDFFENLNIPSTTK